VHRHILPGHARTEHVPSTDVTIFHFHDIGAYAFGALYQTDGMANRFHSPNQV